MNIISIRKHITDTLTWILSMTLLVCAKVLLLMWLYDFYDSSLYFIATEKQRCHMVNHLLHVLFGDKNENAVSPPLKVYCGKDEKCPNKSIPVFVFQCINILTDILNSENTKIMSLDRLIMVDSILHQRCQTRTWIIPYPLY